MILFAILTPSFYLWLLITILNSFVKHVLQNSNLCRAFHLSMTTTGKKTPKHQNPPGPILRLDNVACLDEPSGLTTQNPWISLVALIAPISKQKLHGT